MSEDGANQGREGKLVKITLLNSLQPRWLAVNHVMVTLALVPYIIMKSLLLAPVLASLVHPDIPPESYETEVAGPLAAFAAVEDSPLVELVPVAQFVPIGVNQDDDARVQILREDLEDIAADLMAAQRAVEAVAEQRDQAREEVGALARANHEMRQERKAFREEMEKAHREAASWKARATAFEEQARDRGSLPAEPGAFRAEMAKVMQELRSMKEDIALARGELRDPVEHANLEEQLAESKAREERLGDEIEMALIARERTILEAARNRKKQESRIAALTAVSKGTEELRDELRSSRAGQMKALVDVEILKKQLGRSEEMQDRSLLALQEARESLEALQAEKTATAESRMLAHRERDQARSEADELKSEIAGVRSKVELSRRTVLQLAEELEETEVARQENGRELEIVSGELEKSRKEAVLLNKAKGGLEELLFRKTGEIRKLKGELRGLQASYRNPEPRLANPERGPTAGGDPSGAAEPE